MFNALKYTEYLKAVGFEPEQAEKLVNVLVEIMDENLATKFDLKELEMRLDNRFNSLQSQVEKTEYKLTIKLGSMMTIMVAVIVSLMKIL